MIDNLVSSRPRQVLLKVRFAEVNRSALEDWSRHLQTLNPQDLSYNGDCSAEPISDGNVTCQL